MGFLKFDVYGTSMIINLRHIAKIVKRENGGTIFIFENDAIEKIETDLPFDSIALYIKGVN